MEKNKEKIPNAQCKVCGKEFYAKPYFLKHGWGKYCSKKCKDRGQRRGRYVICACCSEKVYKPFHELHRKSKTKTYFCNKSCQCAWKNKQRKGKKKSKLFKNYGDRGVIAALRSVEPSVRMQIPSIPPLSFPFNFLKFKKKKTQSLFFKGPSKKILYNLYWKKNYSQSEIAKISNATHTSVKRWLNHYKISVKSRTLSCGRNPNSIKNLELGKTPEAEKKSAEARRIYTKEKLIQKIKEFVEKHGRIPTKNEFVHDPSSPDYVTYRDYFGTWNNAIKAAGYEPNERWFFPMNQYSKDGHPCYSTPEIIIDDLLFKNNIPHTKEKSYPEGRYRCDFVVNNIFIEFFGLVNAFYVSPHYTEIIKKKRNICKKFNISLIELYEKDIYNLDQALGKKLGLRLK